MSQSKTLAPPPSPDALADLRHDLRNPIGQILGYSEMLMEEATETGPEALADLERIHHAAQTLLALVDTRLTPESIALPAPAPPPIAPAPATPVPVYPLTDDTLIADSGLILVVDDNDENRDVLARRLEKQGHTVVHAASGGAALAILNEPDVDIDVVLLDIMMPDVDGFEILRRIKADPRLHDTPVIMISALDDTESIVRCIEMGAEDYLAKPFNPTLLKARVGASLRARRAHAREKRLSDRLRDNYDRLRLAESMRDDLTGMMVHDLRTPLTSLLTGLQTVEIVGDLNPDQADMLEIAVEGGKTLLGMINDLLDISKMEDGSLALEYAPLDAAPLIERAVAQVGLLARDKNIALVTDAPADLPAFEADEEKLRRTLVNLLGNALKFTPSGGRVTVGARHEMTGRGEQIHFTVTDTGEGIPREAFERIFEKFGQVESRKAGRRMSTGLGLTFCRMAVEAHGGRIWVESELGVGSVFQFAVPRYRG